MPEACHAEAVHSITLPLAIDACFPLFTPIGEKTWMPGWDPRFLHPADGRARKGMVFTTGDGAEETVWTVIDYDEADHYARYSRVTPGSRSVLVDIRCASVASQRTEVEVRYTLTGLSESGNTAIRSFIGDAYVAMIEEWRTLILKRLASTGPTAEPVTVGMNNRGAA
jgi:hypothetical protein